MLCHVLQETKSMLGPENAKSHQLVLLHEVLVRHSFVPPETLIEDPAVERDDGSVKLAIVVVSDKLGQNAHP